MNYTIHTDGGSRGNPGPAAIGVVIESDNKIIASFGKVIGSTTNNVAEYTAVIEAIRWMIENVKDKAHVQFFLDSVLVVNQLNGLFKVKDEKMRGLMFSVRQLEQESGMHITYTAVRREFNSAADAEVNKALDSN